MSGNFYSANNKVPNYIEEQEPEENDTKKRKLPNRLSKEKVQDYAGDKTKSDNKEDLVPYTIPKKNEEEVIIEKTNIRVRCTFIFPSISKFNSRFKSF